MTTTDRMPNLDSRREITDRLGETVVLGNAVASGVVSSDATIVAAAAGASEARVPFDINATVTMDMYNASFGIWAVFLDVDAVALLAMRGAAIGASRFNDITAGLLAWGAEGTLLNIQVFTATGTYTPTTGTTQIVVHALGGGGGGGGAEATGAGEAAAGGGGGAGAFALGRITSGFSGVTVTIGAGGTGGAAGANNGAAGGTTSFGSVLLASGGGGGTGETGQVPPCVANGGTGGAASGSASLFGSDGEEGDQGFSFTGNLSSPGAGGNTIYGGGGLSNNVAGGSAGFTGTGFGAGGAGGANVASQVARAGGSGVPGLVIIYEYNAT